MGVGSQVVDLVAQGPFDGAEELVVGQIGEGFGHPAERLLEQGAEAVTERWEAGFAVIGGSVRAGIGVTGHGCALAVRENVSDGRTGPERSYPQADDFAPKFVNRSPGPDWRWIFLAGGGPLRHAGGAVFLGSPRALLCLLFARSPSRREALPPARQETSARKEEAPMRRPSEARAAGVGLLAVLLAGCGDGDGRQAVSGTVTFKGQPVDGSIDFIPAAGAGTQAGAVIEKGRYSIPRDKGLVPGTYKVMIFSPDNKEVTPDPGGNPFLAKAKERIPAEYNEKTTLTREVKPGGNTFDFTLD